MNSYQLAEKAFKNEELFELLLGDKGYGKIPKYSPSPDKTDISYVYRGLCDYVSENLDGECLAILEREFGKIAARKEGVEPIASIMVLESDSSRPKRLGLNLEELSGWLKKGVDDNYEALKNDKTGMGRNYDNGKIGNLERLNTIFQSRTGLSFMD